MSASWISLPAANASYYPGEPREAAPPFVATVRIAQTLMHMDPELSHPVKGGRDARLFPGVTLELFTCGDLLVPVQRGEMVRESVPGRVSSYWDVIPQIGRVWREKGDGPRWARAAFPLMLVNDTENHAHQGLALFRYDAAGVSELCFQFVQQTAPYLLKQHFVAWGCADLQWLTPGPPDLEPHRKQVQTELAGRLPSRPWQELLAQSAQGVLEGFGGPIHPKWRVAQALIRQGTLYYQDVPTPFGIYPYPLEMRFGVRSVMKAVGAPLALLRLAEVYGPYVLTLRIGDYVDGLDPKYDRVRFVDAANMATGCGGMGTWQTHPNDMDDGYFGGDYDAWYTAASHDEKIAQMAAALRPYPWDPGTVVRYRDQDFYALGAALDRFLKSLRGPEADIWEMLLAEVFGPIGIARAPAVRTREAGGTRGVIWFNAGYYPTLDDLAKIALLYQNGGACGRRQILHRELTQRLLGACDALVKSGDASVNGAGPVSDPPRYGMGFHFTPYTGSGSGKTFQLPTMAGSGENEVILYPNGCISIRLAKAAQLPPGEEASSGAGPETIQAVDRLDPF